MNSFLRQLSGELYNRYGDRLSDCWLIFPNRRAGLFFSKYLNEIVEQPLFSPRILTSNEMIREFSSLMVEDNLGLLFRLYRKYIEKRQVKESFDEFYHWGEMLLADFDDIDKNRVDARHLFQNLASIKEIEGLFDYLTGEQIEAIKTFWKSFNPERISDHQQDFISVWEVLYGIYFEFREELRSEGLAYEGMAYREVLDRLERGEVELEAEKLIFVGFNALNHCEELLFDWLRDRDKAEFYWDYDRYYLNNPYHEAGLFLRDNLKRYPHPETQIDFSALQRGEKDVEYVAISSDVGQAKFAHQIVKEFVAKGDAEPDEIAIVLADEELLLPVLHSIPSDVKQVNVTMGYPAKNTPVASLLSLIVALQKGGRMLKNGFHFYHKNVLALLNHQYLNAVDPEGIASLVRNILTSNKIYLKPEELTGIGLIENIFFRVETVKQLSTYLLNLLQKVFEHLESAREEKTMVDRMEQEYVYHLFLAVKRLNALLDQHRIELKLDTYYRLLEKMVESLTIPFEGEPLAGLQVMGIMETRLLDFKKVVVLSMNEGKLPKTGAANSYIPYNLRKGFGLPTIDHQDAIFAFYFFRLIQRAGEVKMLYSTQSDGMRTGEMSRFLYQLKYESDFEVRENNPGYDISLPSRKEIAIEKDDRILKTLEQYCNGGRRSYSPSALNTYFGCSLRFYFKYVAGLQEPDEVTEEIDPPTFGNIFHYTMELLYGPYKGKMLTTEILEEIEGDEALIDACLLDSFRENYFKVEKEKPLEISGRNVLVYDILKKYVLQMLKLDRRFVPFEVVGLEHKYKIQIPILEGKQNVQLSGYIDRVDRIGDTIRVIDYKTGKANTRFKNVASLFDRESKDRNGAAFQTMLYCLFYEENFDTNYALSPGIYSLKEIYNDNFQCQLEQKEGRAKGVKVDDYRMFRQEFVENLTNLLEEIYNPEIPFAQVEDENNCRNCPYAEICHRN
ncbi:MAG: PD-(D/E)XK nuclease family protein [Marinifilaceae bacterium]